MVQPAYPALPSLVFSNIKLMDKPKLVIRVYDRFGINGKRVSQILETPSRFFIFSIQLYVIHRTLHPVLNKSLYHCRRRTGRR